MHKIHTLSTNYVFRGEVEGMSHSFFNGGKYIRGSLTARGSNNSRHYS